MAKIFQPQNMDWIELNPGHFDKPFVTDEKTGMIVNMSKYSKGYTMPVHTHTCTHGIYVIEGKMSTDIGIVNAREFIWWPAGEVMQHGALPAKITNYVRKS